MPYRGLSQAINDLLSGQIDMMFDQVVTATPQILWRRSRSDRCDGANRAASIPDVPSSTEAGLPKLETIAWTALFAPKGTPKAIVEQINAAVDQAMRDPLVAKLCAELGADLPAPAQRTPQTLGDLVRAEVDKWAPLIRASGAVSE